MNVSVWDTYVQREDGRLMHFDILVPSSLKDEQKVLLYGNNYLSTKPFKSQKITTRECSFCHTEIADSIIASTIGNDAYYILEMQNCD